MQRRNQRAKPPGNKSPKPKKERLTPSKIYTMAVGMFTSLSSEYELEHVIVNHVIQNSREIARIYRNRQSGEHHILYYPGRDVEKTDKPNSACWLKTIREEVDKTLATLYTQEECDRANKHFIVCESGKYSPINSNKIAINADHFVYACRIGNRLLVEDSIKRDYREEAIHDAVMDPPPTLTQVHHGWQNQLIDHWQCGHYVLQAMYRQLTNTVAPKKLTISDAILRRHEAYYQLQEPVPEAKRVDLLASDQPRQESHTTEDDSSEWPDLEIPHDEREKNVSEKKPSHIARPWVRNLAIAAIFVGAGLLAAGITFLTGGAGITLTPLIFGLAIAGATAGGLLTTAGGLSLIGHAMARHQKSIPQQANQQSGESFSGSTSFAYRDLGVTSAPVGEQDASPSPTGSPQPERPVATAESNNQPSLRFIPGKK